MAFLVVAARSDADECIAWPYTRDRNGRGQIWNGHKVVPACRVVCELRHGPAPSVAHEAAHNCGNGHLGCITPLHLRWATHAENMADQFTHGTIAFGENNGAARLTAADVLNIRSLFGQLSQRKIAARFNVSPETIAKIRRGETWAWLP